MSMEWFRMYHGMPFDPKLQVVAKRAVQPMGLVVAVWACILDAASQHDPRGIAEIDPEAIAVVQGLELEAVEAILAALQAKRLLEKDGTVVNWDKRQHTTSTERMKKHRDKKKREVTAGDTAQQKVTRSDAVKRKNSKKSPDTDKDTETDSEENTDTKKESDKKIRKRKEKRETEGEKQQTCGKDAELEQILNQMKQIWDEEVQSKITPERGAELNVTRRKLLVQRWENEFAKDIEAWRHFCEIIGRSEFCLGSKGWTIDLTWAVESNDHIIKILEGGYSGGKHPSKPPPCAIPEFKRSWSEIIQRMEKKHQKPVIRAWFAGSLLKLGTATADGLMLTLECRSEFMRGKVSELFLADLNHIASEYHIGSRLILGIQLTIKEATS